MTRASFVAVHKFHKLRYCLHVYSIRGSDLFVCKSHASETEKIVSFEVKKQEKTITDHKKFCDS